jgi:glycine betaine/proline transport system substrate-binding protein
MAEGCRYISLDRPPGPWDIPPPKLGPQRRLRERTAEGGVATARELVRRASAWVGLFALGTALLLVAGCGDDDEPAASESPGQGETIRIAVNPWTGSAVNANVAKVLLERELGYRVELVEIDENSQFPAIARGDLDATLEVWPSGHAADINRYIEGRRGGFLRDGGMIDVGELGLIGNIGWWIPTYLVEERPELARWQGLKGSEDVVNGEFIAGDPTFVSYDEEIIKSLGLDLEVVNTGSEQGIIDALDEAVSAERPILTYFYTPHWVHRKYDLTEVQLPAYDEECEEAARERDGEGYDCDYANDVLFKAVWLGLEDKAPEAFDFFSRFRYTTEDQQEIAFQVDSEGVPIDQAAEQWVDENPSVWRAWLR